jgi:uncharacterized membrane protein
VINIKQWLKIFILFLIGGFIYVAIELGFRGHSHWTMFLLGGLCFILIGGLNNYIPWEMSIIKQGVIGALIVTSLEFIFGLILNLYLNLGIWDYSNMPFNILGQICLPFSIAWFFLSLAAIFVDDWLRYVLFKEEKPHYHLFTVCKEENK